MTDSKDHQNPKDRLNPQLRELYEQYGEPGSPTIVLTRDSAEYQNLSGIIALADKNGFRITVRHCVRTKKSVRVTFRHTTGYRPFLWRYRNGT